MNATTQLLPVARYTPWTKGMYDVAPALRPLGTDFGNGESDLHLIQLDSDFERYRRNKLSAYQEETSKYAQELHFSGTVALAVAKAMASHLSGGFPAHYSATDRSLACHLTGETVAWTDTGELDVQRSSVPATARSLLQALALQIQPDLAVVVRKPDGGDQVAAVNVCAPSHWDPVEKVGQSFFQTHTVVPGFERINAAAPRMVDAMIRQGPFVRFVWGVESDDRLNHHPKPPPGEDFNSWDGRLFDGRPFWVRVERQSLLGLPECDAALFVIHAKTVPGWTVLDSEHERTSLLSAIRSMSPEALKYKGLAKHFDGLLRSLAP